MEGGNNYRRASLSVWAHSSARASPERYEKRYEKRTFKTFLANLREFLPPTTSGEYVSEVRPASRVGVPKHRSSR
jgi:hypothetical protein